MHYSNGFLVTGFPQNYNGVFYSGIENNAWPLEDYLLEKSLETVQITRFYNFIDDLSIQPFSVGLIDFVSLKDYQKACEDHGQDYRILYIEVEGKELPLNHELQKQFALSNNFLGYDVGICAYDYYSALLSDVIGHMDLFKSSFSSLNQNGLFESINSVNIYLEERMKLVNELPQVFFESGNMDIISLYQVSAL